jgi:hypothetical protein
LFKISFLKQAPPISKVVARVVFFFFLSKFKKINFTTEIMAEQFIEKRKYVWQITNFTREACEKYGTGNYVDSDQFEILLGENKTRW